MTLKDNFPEKQGLGYFEKYLRLKMGYSIENVAKDIGISKGNLSEIENGKRVMRFELFNNFSAFTRFLLI